MYGASMLSVLAAVPAWKPGGGSPRPLWYATGFLALGSAQGAAGIAHLPSAHLPLGDPQEPGLSGTRQEARSAAGPGTSTHGPPSRWASGSSEGSSP